MSIRVDDDKKLIRCGVKDFIGPLDEDRWDLPAMPNRPLLGIKAHLRYAHEREGTPGFQKEVPLTLTFTHGGYTFEIHGRADGIIQAADSRRVEEVKSLTLDGDELAYLGTRELPSAKLQVSLYCYALSQDGAGPVYGSIILKSVFDHRERQIGVDWSPEDVETFLHSRGEELVSDHEAYLKWIATRREVVGTLPFPFPEPRPIQRAMLGEIEPVLRGGEDILLEAPTGTGKSAVALYSAIKRAFESDKRVVFVTAKTTGQEAAAEVIRRLQAQGIPISALMMTARAKLCLQLVVYCHPDHCPHARDHHEKLRQSKVVPFLRQSGLVEREDVIEAGEAHELCPFEIAVEVGQRVDVLICDYNYVFHPMVRMSRFFENAPPDSLLLVIDEAHNLAARSREYYSPTLDAGLCEALGEYGRGRGGAFGRRIEAVSLDMTIEISQWMADSGLEEVESGIVPWEPDDEAFKRWQVELADLLMDDPLRRRFRPFPGEEDILMDVYRRLSHMGNVLGSLGEDVRITYLKQDGKTVSAGVLCLDASEELTAHLKPFASTIAMSATLSPDAFYRDTLGLSSTSVLASFPSPFPPSNRAILIVDGVTTRFRERARHLPEIARVIMAAARMVRGNYAVYVPSYTYLRQLESHIHDRDLEIYRDSRGMNDALRQGILSRMSQPLADAGGYRAPRARILLAVQGGSFAEAVEWPAGILQGVFVVGPGLPRVGFEQEQLKGYYQRRFGSGFAYAYLYPGMARVIQSAGRLIRRETDRGVVLLIGSRFGEGTYSQALPRHWYEQDVSELMPIDALDALATFWRGQGEEPEIPEPLEARQDGGDGADPWERFGEDPF